MKCQNIDKKVSKLVNTVNLFSHYLATLNRPIDFYFWRSINICQDKLRLNFSCLSFIVKSILYIRHSKLTFPETGDLDFWSDEAHLISLKSCLKPTLAIDFLVSDFYLSYIIRCFDEFCFDQIWMLVSWLRAYMFDVIQTIWRQIVAILILRET